MRTLFLERYSHLFVYLQITLRHVPVYPQILVCVTPECYSQILVCVTPECYSQISVRQTGAATESFLSARLDSAAAASESSLCIYKVAFGTHRKQS